MFKDRIEAADRLERALQPAKASHPLVLAIARGAVPMGAHLARRLGADLDVVLVRKLAAPFSPELAVGAVDETGQWRAQPHAAACGATPQYLALAAGQALAEIRRRRALYTPGRSALPVAGRTVIVLDDGLATGATMCAALDHARAGKPARLICAVPVASREALTEVRSHADEVICLYTPASFDAVGHFYRHFPQVEDEEVIRCLASPIANAPSDAPSDTDSTPSPRAPGSSARSPEAGPGRHP